MAGVSSYLVLVSSCPPNSELVFGVEDGVEDVTKGGREKKDDGSTFADSFLEDSFLEDSFLEDSFLDDSFRGNLDANVFNKLGMSEELKFIPFKIAVTFEKSILDP